MKAGPKAFKDVQDATNISVMLRERPKSLTMHHISNHVIKALVLVAFLIIPLIYSDWTDDPATFPKMLALQLLLLVGLPIVWRKSKPWAIETLSREIPILCLAFILFSLCSIAWGTNPLFGFYSFIRDLTVALFYIFVLLSLRHLTQEFLLKTLVVAGTVLAAIGLFQSLGWGFSFLRGTTKPPYATLVNKNAYASVMLILFAFAAVSVWRLKGRWRYLSLFSALVIFTALLFTGTRGAWVGFAIALAGTMAIAPSLVIRQKLFPGVKPLTVVSVSALVIAMLGAVGYSANLYLATAYDYSIWARIKSIFLFEDMRFRHWQDTLKMVKDAPIGGVGLRNWTIELPKYSGYYERNRPLSPHNEPLQILSETGVIGLLIYLGLICFHFKYLIQAFCSKEISRHRLIFLLGVFFATTAYLGHSMFTYPRSRIYVSMLFGLCLALSTYRGIANKAPPLYLTKLTHLMASRVVLTSVYAVLVLVFAITIQRTYADGYGKHPYYDSILPTPSWDRMVSFSTRAIDHGMVADGANSMYWYRGYGHLRRGEIERAKADLEKAYQQTPHHVGVLTVLHTIYQREGRLDEAAALYRRALIILSNAIEVKVNLDETRKSIAPWKNIEKQYDPPLLNAYGINITFGKPVEKGTIAIGRLFRIWEGHRKSLDKNRITKGLRKRFKKLGIPLTPIATVSIEEPGSRWLITDGYKKYKIRKTGGRLSIFVGLGWMAKWDEKSAYLQRGKGKQLKYRATYRITVSTRDKAGNPLNPEVIFRTKARR